MKKCITVTEHCWERLGDRRRAGETYDDVLRHLLDEVPPRPRVDEDLVDA